MALKNSFLNEALKLEWKMFMHAIKNMKTRSTTCTEAGKVRVNRGTSEYLTIQPAKSPFMCHHVTRSLQKVWPEKAFLNCLFVSFWHPGPCSATQKSHVGVWKSNFFFLMLKKKRKTLGKRMERQLELYKREERNGLLVI